MNKKKIIVPLVLLLAAAFYFVFLYKNKTLKFVPKDADAVVLIDVKKLTGQYISSLIAHPSKWTDSQKKDKKTVSLKDSGIRIPDFLQVFHLKNTGFSEWYTVLELKNSQKFQAFLKSHQFISKGKNTFRKDQVFIKIEGENCMVGTSASAFDKINQQLLLSPGKDTFNADQFISGTLGSISFISGQKIRNFSIELKDDRIEIKNTSATRIFTSVISEISKNNHLLESELDADNIKNVAHFFDKSFTDSARISYFKATAEIEQVNDTIISYEYDDNFNEIEKKTYQKIIQPRYIIDLQSQNPEKTWNYFQQKKWINGQDQFTAIPFQPNRAERNNDGLTVKSVKKPIALSPKLERNYIYIKNSPLLFSSLSTLTSTEKRILSDIDYIFYGNNEDNYWVNIQAHKGTLPLLLRW